MFESNDKTCPLEWESRSPAARRGLAALLAGNSIIAQTRAKETALPLLNFFRLVNWLLDIPGMPGSPY